MRINHRFYIYSPGEPNVLPNKHVVNRQHGVLDKIRSTAPHVLKKEKCFLANMHISWIKSLKNGKNYPFKNGELPETKGGIVWTDYHFEYWPLMIVLLSLYPDRNYDDFSTSLIVDTKNINWNYLLNLLDVNQNSKELVSSDELDRWYDEISATLIQPTSYHALYGWFGHDLQQIGYDAFDYFMDERNGQKAWHKVLDQRLQAIHNLPDDVRKYLMEAYLFPLLQFA